MSKEKSRRKLKMVAIALMAIVVLALVYNYVAQATIGELGLSVEINYVDGTKRTIYSPTFSALQTVSPGVFDSDKEVTSITVKALLKFKKDVVGFLDGQCDVKFDNMLRATFPILKPITVQADVVREVEVGSIASSTIMGWAEENTSDTHTMLIEVPSGSSIIPNSGEEIFLNGQSAVCSLKVVNTVTTPEEPEYPPATPPEEPEEPEEPPPSEPRTYLFSDGFETGDISQWDAENLLGGGTVSVVTSNPKYGTHNLRSIAPGGAHQRALVSKLFAARTSVYFRAYVCISSATMPASNERLTLMALYPSGSPYTFVCTLTVLGNTIVTYYGNADVQYSSYNSGVQVVKGRYYLLEIYAKTGAGDGQIKMWLDEQLIIDLSGLQNSIYGPMIECRTGIVFTECLAQQIVDVDEAALDGSYIGPV